MIVTNFSVKHRVAVFVLMGGLALLGTFSYMTLPRESSPDIKVPLVTIAVPWPEASPADVEQSITLPLERKLKNLKGLDELTSVSVEGASITTCKFDPDIPVEEALQKVREKVDIAKTEFPVDAEDETVSELSFSEFPIMIVTLYGAEVPVLEHIAEELQDRIETIPGVLSVGINGGTLLASSFVGSGKPMVRSRSFLEDIVSEGGDAEISRLQMLVWNGLLGVVFVWQSVSDWQMPTFDSYLTTLLGISSTAYVGYKVTSK